MTLKQLLSYLLFLEIAIVSVGVLVERRLGLGFQPSDIVAAHSENTPQEAAVGLPVPSTR